MENFNKFCLSDGFLHKEADYVKELQSLITKMDYCFKKDADNFASICYLTFKIKELFNGYYFYNLKKQSYSFDTIMLGFGISKSESCRLLKCYEKFVTKATDKPMVLAEFYGFSKSKLFELLQVDSEQIVKDLQSKVLRFDFTVNQIRQYVKNYLTLKKENNKITEKVEDSMAEIEEEIPPAYNPEQHYDFNYFESKSKSQLLNIVWDLQKTYENLKKQFNKLKKS